MSTSTKAQSSARATRRRFTVEEKLRILAEYEAATTPESRGAVLRREGIYSSHIALWRQKRDSGGKAALDRKRGPKPNPQARELEKLAAQMSFADTALTSLSPLSCPGLGLVIAVHALPFQCSTSVRVVDVTVGLEEPAAQTLLAESAAMLHRM